MLKIADVSYQLGPNRVWRGSCVWPELLPGNAFRSCPLSSAVPDLGLGLCVDVSVCRVPRTEFQRFPLQLTFALH